MYSFRYIQTVNSNGPVKGMIINDKYHGIWEYYSHDGKLISKETYRHGIKQGFSIHTDPTHTYVRTCSFYNNGIPEGKWTTYDNDGTIKRCVTYLNGSMTGPYFENQTDTYCEGQMKDYNKVGIWTWYKKNLFSADTVFKQEFYDEHKPILKKICYYYENGNIKETTIGGNEFCHRFGIWKFYNLDGILTHEYSYHNSNYPCGWAKYYKPDGSIKEEGEYSFEGRVGVWNSY